MVGAAVYYYFHSAACGVIAFLTGVLVDLDHIPDFLIQHGFKKYKKFFEISLATDLKKLYLFLHSIELAVIFWVLIIVLRLDKYWVAAAIGFTQHLAFDIIFNPLGISGYLIIYRKFMDFETKKLLKRR